MTRPGRPVPPIALAGGAESARTRIGAEPAPVGDDFIARLGAECPTSTDAGERGEAGRDWWPLAMTWATDGMVGALPAVIARPTTVDQVSAVARLCHEARVPLTPAAGRSGVCGGAVPLRGGVVLDLCGLQGDVAVDAESLVADVAAGTFGDALEDELRLEHQLTTGHWPQSMALSTVGGWLACRSAGQYSTRYGKIEDMVIGLDVVLADGTRVTTGGAPRAAAGPDLTQLFVGSEGTLAIIVGARLRVHPVAQAEQRRCYSFASFPDGLDACRRILRRGATPAVLRLYDSTESKRNFDADGDEHLLIVLDEADPAILGATMAIVDDECGTDRLVDVAVVERWMQHRNDVSALESLIGGGLVVDTMEIAAPWSALDGVYDAALAAMRGVDGTLAVSAHQSHAYTDGACLYFTFGGKPPPDQKDRYYRAVWDAGTRAVLEGGGSLSHHHGIGLNRARFMPEALGAGLGVLQSVKDALDPHGILNPGKLGLADRFARPGEDLRW